MIGLRARLPYFVRVLALFILVSGVVYIGISYNRLRKIKPFHMFPGAAELSTRVVSRTENFEHAVYEGSRLTILVRAALDVAYEDGHHELDQVHVEHYGKEGDQPEQINSHKAIYNREINRISFTGDVQLETSDHLIAKSETIIYDINQEHGESPVPLTFVRENVQGRADSAVVDAKNKRLSLRGGVEITVTPQAKAAASQSKTNVRNRPLTVHAQQGDFDQAKLHIAFSGGATAEQERDIMSGDSLTAQLNEQKHVQKIEARGNSYLRSMNEGRAAEVHATDMDFNFDEDQRLQNALALKDIKARTLDADAEMQLTASTALQLEFVAQGEQSLLKQMSADGRPVVTLAAPRTHATDPRASNKRLTANTIKLYWRATGKDLEHAEAVGDAELVVEPVQQSPTADRKTLQAPRFDGDFYEAGNLVRNFTATGGAKAVITPLEPSEKRGMRTLTAQKMTAAFLQDTQDVERLDAQGDTQFNELDRNGQAANASYTTADGMIKLRGGEPVVWDSRARLKANEIDSDMNKKISYARGRTQTTYYSQEQTNGATPFGKVKSPVFVTAGNAEFQHESGVGIYTNDARSWQDDNFVKADRIIIRHDNRRMEADGSVQSMIYNARRKEAAGNRTVVPVFATANHMFYSDTDRLIHYEGNVDIKQGTERITSEVEDVYLLKDSSEVDHSIAQRNVVLTQPGKRGTGDWAQYIAADETVMLTGNPAHVEDTEQGTTEGKRLTVYLRENRVVADSPGGAQSTGRIHSTHKVKKQ